MSEGFWTNGLTDWQKNISDWKDCQLSLDLYNVYPSPYDVLALVQKNVHKVHFDQTTVFASKINKIKCQTWKSFYKGYKSIIRRMEDGAAFASFWDTL